MPPRRLQNNSPVKLSASRRKSYHHGNLSAALVDVTLLLIEEAGPDKVTVRQVAKRAGVSSGAPFRHFPNRTALMTAVAEQAMGRFREEITIALQWTESDDPLVRLSAMGRAYIHWAIQNPAHFRVISDRSLIDFEGSALLRRQNEEIRAIMDGLLGEAERRGALRPDALPLLPLALRGLVYGLARMYIDGHLPQWGVAKDNAEETLKATLDLIVNSLPQSH